MFAQNPPHTLDQIEAKHIPMKNDLITDMPTGYE